MAVVVAAVVFGVARLTAPTRHSSVVITNRPPKVQTAPTTAPASPRTTTAAGQSSPPPCMTSQLSITAQPASGGSNHSSVLIAFRNGGAPCRISGYPGVAGLDGSGKEAMQAQRTPTGPLGGLGPVATSPPIVDLRAGDTASAILEGSNAPTDPTIRTSIPCPTYAGVLVTPPGETHAAHLSLGFSMCSAEIHPIVPGPGGGQPVQCSDVVFRTQSSDFASNIIATATSCAVARSVVAAGPDTTSPGFGKSYTAKGFTCTATGETQPPGGGMASWGYECTGSHGALVAFDRYA
jgi:hypothetical protein